MPLRPAHINEARQVAGATTGHLSALWTEQSGLRELPLPTGFYNSEGVAVNNSGHLTGVVFDRDFSNHQAFIFAKDVLTLLAGEQSRPYDISDLKKLSENPCFLEERHGFASWNKSTIRLLGGYCTGSAKGVNKNAVAIVDAYDEAGRYQAFLGNANKASSRIPDRHERCEAASADLISAETIAVNGYRPTDKIRAAGGMFATK